MQLKYSVLQYSLPNVSIYVYCNSGTVSNCRVLVYWQTVLQW